MSMPEICLSTRANQLLRWQQAFPQGRISAAIGELEPFLRHEGLVWLHADAMPGRNVEDAIRNIREITPVARFIVLSSMPAPADALSALQLGAQGYCHTLATPKMLQQVALVVRNGGLWIGPDLLNRLTGTLGATLFPTSPHKASILQQLSTREQEVSLQVGSGASNKEIATVLGITERTVKAHLGSIFEKLGIRDRLQLALLLSQEESDRFQQIGV